MSKTNSTYPAVFSSALWTRRSRTLCFRYMYHLVQLSSRCPNRQSLGGKLGHIAQPKEWKHLLHWSIPQHRKLRLTFWGHRQKTRAAAKSSSLLSVYSSGNSGSMFYTLGCPFLSEQHPRDHFTCSRRVPRTAMYFSSSGSNGRESNQRAA